MSLSSNNGRLTIESNASSSSNRTGGLIISSELNGGNGNTAIELWRGGNASWQIANEGGTLFIRNNWTNARQNTYTQNGLIMDFNTGAASLPYLALGQTGRNTSYKLYVNGVSYFNGNMWLGGSDDMGIYYAGPGDGRDGRVIRFTSSNDAYGVGVHIGGGGYTSIGGGESVDTLWSNLGYASGSEITVIGSDGNILFYPGQNSYDASALITMSQGRLWAGVNGNTTRENQVGVQSGAG